jgi:WD40 repeat protein
MCYIFDSFTAAFKERFLLGSSFELIRTLSSAPVSAMVLTPDQHTLITAGSEICSWRTANRSIIHAVATATSAITSLNYIVPDGQHTLLISGHDDSSVGLWCSVALVLLARIQVGSAKINHTLPFFLPLPPAAQEMATDPTSGCPLQQFMQHGYLSLWVGDSDGCLNLFTSSINLPPVDGTAVALIENPLPSSSDPPPQALIPVGAVTWKSVRRRQRRSLVLSKSRQRLPIPDHAPSVDDRDQTSLATIDE